MGIKNQSIHSSSKDLKDVIHSFWVLQVIWHHAGRQGSDSRNTSVWVILEGLAVPVEPVTQLQINIDASFCLADKHCLADLGSMSSEQVG